MFKFLAHVSIFICAYADSWNATTPFKLLSSVIPDSEQHHNYGSSDGLYYIYPWSESYYWRFPLDNSTCKDAGLQHYMMENSGVCCH